MFPSLRSPGCLRIVSPILLAASVFLAGPDRAITEDALRLETIDDPLPYFDGGRVRDPVAGDRLPPLRLLLSRSRYWAEDGHLDIVLQFNEPGPDGGLRLRILGDGEREFAVFHLPELPGPRFVVYPALPPELMQGGAGEVEAAWLRDGAPDEVVRKPFRVETYPEPGPPSGRIPLRLANEAGLVQQGLPARVGVPIPRGALRDTANVRLVDAGGTEIPVQVEETGRWSRFGTIKWILCSFTADLSGDPLDLYLEYGPDVRRMERPAIAVAPVGGAGGFPAIDAGRLRLDRGLAWRMAEDGTPVPVLSEDALRGAFVEHEDGRLFRMPGDTRWEVEESGAEAIVLRGEGWYRDDSGDPFCRHITRYVIHRDSPLVRIFHTWIFTGDGNRDRVRNMGWSFPAAEDFRPGGFRLPESVEGGWAAGDYLLHYDYEHFEIVSDNESRAFPGGRAPGIARMESPEARLYFGARDFWQNYPSELELRGSTLFFHTWPRHNRPARFTFDGEVITAPGEAALPSAARYDHVQPGRLTRSEWKLNIIQARFAHEGEVLDFRLPDRLAEDPIWRRMSRDRTGSTYWAQGNPESANAQGISRTEEMWLLVAPADRPAADAARVLEGLNDETLRFAVDPAWVAASGAFFEIHPRDPENYREEERLFERLALAPAQWQERLGLYGMWIYGDLAIWGEVSLERREPQLYRAFRKRHHGWPYSWIPYARSGDPRLLRAADAAARQNIDANHCHYVSDDVRRQVEASSPLFHRRRGLLHRSTLPWATRRGATTRCYETQTDYLWHSWFLTGYHRARDVVMDWAELVKEQETLPGRGPVSIGGSTRASLAILKSCIETYEATFDPWFLAMAHGIAEGHRVQYERGGYSTHGAEEAGLRAAGHFWQAGDRDYLRFTGDPAFLEYYLAYADFWGGHWGTPSWQVHGAPVVESNAYAWLQTGEPYYLRRVAHFLDVLTYAVWDGDTPEFARGYYARGGSHAPPIYTGWALQYFPLALSALERAGERPDPVPDLFETQERNPVIAFRKTAGTPVSLRLRAGLRGWGRRPQHLVPYRLTGPTGVLAEGTWQIADVDFLEIPAEAPAGVYRLELEDARGLVLPVARDVDVPEVALFPADGRVALGQYENQLWFRVPEGMERFGIEIPLGDGLRPRRVSVWDAEGHRAWDLSHYPGAGAGEDTVTAEMAVPDGQDGRLWRITIPGAGVRFKMDPGIRPVYAVCRTRWFDPDL